jgi:hypothetical protein
MSVLAMLPLVLLLTASAPLARSAANGAERRPHLQSDDCARRGLSCERRCDAMRGAERLSCKTECRIAESRCRSGHR